MNRNIICSAGQMQTLERRAMARGLAGTALMEAAGKGVARHLMQTWSKRPVTVLCGPGNNGGDGYVTARLLAGAGWPVRLEHISGPPATGDAAAAAARYGGHTAPAGTDLPDGTELVVDALFGTGLKRPLSGRVAGLVRSVNASGKPVLSIDIPSGINADTGAVTGEAVRATRTVTFHCKKTGHLLMPGRLYSGAADIVDIGISNDDMNGIRFNTFENTLSAWAGKIPQPSVTGHKYRRGSVFAVSGPLAKTGAARLAARGALRIGAGLVTVLSPRRAIPENAAHLTAVMTGTADHPRALRAYLQDPGRYENVCITGPGNGTGRMTRRKTLAVLKTGIRTVVDADSITAFEKKPSRLLDALDKEDVLTPHDGEFSRLFPDVPLQEGKLAAARHAAELAGSTVVLKGADTVVAKPDGVACINTQTTPYLATAGAGDVLAGFIAGLMAQGMSGFPAACTGVLLHGLCGRLCGPGLIAEDLPEVLPQVLKNTVFSCSSKSGGFCP